MGRHHFTPPIPLRHHWNIIRCLLTFKSCSAAVISIGPAAISVKCPLATLLLHMEDFLSPSMVSLFYFAPSLHLAFSPPCPLKPACGRGWEPLALRKWATTGDAVGQKTVWKTLTPLDSDMFVLHCVPLEENVEYILCTTDMRFYCSRHLKCMRDFLFFLIQGYNILIGYFVQVTPIVG